MEKFTIYITNNEILQQVYAQSAFYCAHNESRRILTEDNERMLLLKIKEGYNDFVVKAGRYLEFANYNPNIEANNIYLTFNFSSFKSLDFQISLKDSIISMLSNFVLMKYYGEIDDRGFQFGSSIFYLEWRRYRSKILISFAQDLL